MSAYVETVNGDIVLKFNKLLVEEGENEISVSQNFLYVFSDTVGEGSMFYLILTMILVVGHEEPWLLL